MKVKHIEGLDVVRGIAVLLVMLFHFPTSEFPGKVFQIIGKVSIFGQTGVDLFFVLSGFLITRILLSSREREGFFKNFYVRRFLRIFPLYYGFLFLFFFIVPLLTHEPVPKLRDQLWSWVFLQNLPMTFASATSVAPSHFWSLAVEEHFYLIWPVLVFFNSPRRLAFIACGLIIAAFVARIVLVELNFNVFYFTLCRMDALALGALLALVEMRRELKKFQQSFAIGAGVLFLLLCLMWLRVGGQENVVVQVVKYLLIGLLYFCVVGWIAAKNLNVVGYTQRYLAFTGKISFGLYVFHPLVFLLLFKYWHLTNFSSAVLIAFSVSYIVAFVSYNLYEKRFLELKKYFEYDQSRYMLEAK